MSNPVKSSDKLSASGVICNAESKVRGARLFSDGTNACTLTIYDNPSAASGTVLAFLTLKASPGVLVDELNLPDKIMANSGIYAAVSGTGASFIVYFERG